MFYKDLRNKSPYVGVASKILPRWEYETSLSGCKAVPAKTQEIPCQAD